MADKKDLTIYTLHRSHTYVQERQFNGRQKRFNYLHTTQKSYIRPEQTIQWPTEKINYLHTTQKSYIRGGQTIQ
jgi:hypothetical protein